MAVLYTNINWLAVIIGTVIAFGLGGPWYSARMFGTKWAEGSRIKAITGHPLPALLVQLSGTFLLAWIIGIAAGNDAIWVGVLAVLTVTVILAGSCLFSQKNSYATLTESGFVVANGIIMVACQQLL